MNSEFKANFERAKATGKRASLGELLDAVGKSNGGGDIKSTILAKLLIVVFYPLYVLIALILTGAAKGIGSLLGLGLGWLTRVSIRLADKIILRQAIKDATVPDKDFGQG